MILGTLVNKMIDEVWELIKLGYKKMDEYNDFSDVYEYAFQEYKRTFGEDSFYQMFFVDGLKCRKKIRKMFSRDILTRELPNDVMSYIATELGETQTNKLSTQIAEFIGTLISELLCLDSHRERIAEYRRDADSGEIKTDIGEIKTDIGEIKVDIGEMKDNINIVSSIVRPGIHELCRKSCRPPAKKYTEKLFLDEDANAKTVKSVYVEPFFKLYDGHNRIESNQNICEFISEFLCKDTYRKNKILLILANAGMGKSTLLSKLAYEYVYQNGEINGYKKVFTIKLSDYDSTSETPLKDICTNLGVRDVAHLKNSLLLMDAYDELRKTNHDVNEFYENFIDSVTEINCKIIMTSRLNYFDFNSFNMKRGRTVIVELLPFNEKQRGTWIDRYEKPLSSVAYLKSPLNKEDSAFLGIPIVLYFIAHDNVNIASMTNKYELYNNLFGIDAIKCRQYSRFHHNIRRNATELYELMQDMSFYTFKRDTDLVINKNNFMNTIVFENRDKWENKDVDNLKKYCGLVGYFNNKDNEILEYVHKSIYEFYLSVKIYTTLKQAFQAYSEHKENISDYISNISHQLLYAKLTDQTLEFIYEQIKSDIAELSPIATNITNFMYEFLLLGPKTKHIKELTFFTQIGNVFSNIWRIYNKLILLTKKEKDLEDWFKNNDKSLLLFEFIGLSHYEQLDLTSLNLNGARLNSIHLTLANLSDADLRGANLSGVDLCLADLCGANLSGVDLRGADFNLTRLDGANLSDADLRGVDLNLTSLNGVNLSGADLRRADLHDTNLSDTDLRGADLRGADLHDTNIIWENVVWAEGHKPDLSETHLGMNLSGAIFSTTIKTKITLDQLRDLIERGLNLDYFKVYKDIDTDSLATPEEIADIIENTK